VRTNADGSDSKVKRIPDVYTLQRNAEHRLEWIKYSSLDAITTWFVHSRLSFFLSEMAWKLPSSPTRIGSMLDFYHRYMVDFGELLTDMERRGILVDTQVHLKEAERKAREEKSRMEDIFITWASKYNPDAKFINVGSTSQIQQLFFGYYENGQFIEKDKVFKIDKSDDELQEDAKRVLEVNKYANLTTVDLKLLLKNQKLKISGKKADLIARLMENDNKTSSSSNSANSSNNNCVDLTSQSLEQLQDLCIARGLESSDDRDEMLQRLSTLAQQQLEKNANVQKAKKYREITISSIQMKPLAFTPGGSPQVSAGVLRKMAGQNLFGDGKQCCTDKFSSQKVVIMNREGRRLCS